MRQKILGVCLLAGLVWVSACADGETDPKDCQTEYVYDWQAMLPGPGEAGFDAELAEVARKRDRQFHVFHTLPTGLNAEISISADKEAERAAIVKWLDEDQGWDFEASSGLSVSEAVDGWWKVAGAYAGVGIAADAFRYGVLRDQCYPIEEQERARQHLILDLEALHMASAITGIDGGAVRGFANLNYPGAGDNEELTPLFDGEGNPLPEEKSNGTWRADNSGGRYPDFIWEDSCSRDMLIGWAMAYGAIWEVIESDTNFADDLKERLRTDARAMVLQYMEVRENGYDLEVPDPDGRTTYHGYLNENNLDRMYIPGVRNGFHTIMALGIVAALSDVADDPLLDAYLYGELIEEREFAVIARDNILLLNVDTGTNFSNYNMAVQGAWLALRHLNDAEARGVLQQAFDAQIYDTPDMRFQPVEMGQSFFDFAYAAGMCGAAAGQPCLSEPDQAAIDRGLASLKGFPLPPFFDFERINCDEAEVAAGHCVADDGESYEVLGYVGRNGDLILSKPLPMSVRPPSNYYWRSNPYRPNGGSAGSGMFPGVDFRLAYWLGRWVRRP
ncbi:MAG: hypothetical protein JRF33_01980 [Deltaproteobacteria bacterium]|nr:hypothetical protein [Deltaproteobacteria bacterium]